MLALSPDIAYIHEPFNLNHSPGICRARFDYWFPYICDENEVLILNDISDCLNFKYHIFEELQASKSPAELLPSVLDCLRFQRNRILNKRPLMKDPIAVFSTEWLEKRFNMNVIIVVRHPAAFVGSIKAAKWTHPFDHFLKQPLLMGHHLVEYRRQIEDFSKSEADIVDQAILLWNMIYHTILKYRENQPDWIFVTHEALSKNPIREFGKLYQKLGLHYSTNIQEKIKGYSTADLSKVQSNKLKRDSKANIWTWKTRLNEQEIQRVKAQTIAIASVFYDEEDWLG